MSALFIGPFEGVERFRNLKFAVIRITDIQKTVLSFSEGTTAIHFAFKQRLINNKPSYYYSNGPAKIYTEVDCDWWRRTFRDSQESPGLIIVANMFCDPFDCMEARLLWKPGSIEDVSICEGFLKTVELL